MVVQAALGAAFGFPLLSAGVFAAGIISALIDVDYFVSASKKVKTPLGHSVLSAAIWIYIVSFALYIGMMSGDASRAVWLEGTLAIISAYASHLAIDTLTEDGIYTIPKSGRVRSWTAMDKGIWTGWGRFSLSGRMSKKRSDDDALLNTGICVASLALLLAFIALI